jgi:hypothetical protein
MAVSMKIVSFWDIAPFSLGVDRRFRGAYCFHHQGCKFITPTMERVRTSKKYVYFNKTTQRNIPEGVNLEDIRSYAFFIYLVFMITVFSVWWAC